MATEINRYEDFLLQHNLVWAVAYKEIDMYFYCDIGYKVKKLPLELVAKFSYMGSHISGLTRESGCRFDFATNQFVPEGQIR